MGFFQKTTSAFENVSKRISKTSITSNDTPRSDISSTPSNTPAPKSIQLQKAARPKTAAPVRMDSASNTALPPAQALITGLPPSTSVSKNIAGSNLAGSILADVLPAGSE